jgi:hypothetical protein
VAVEERAAARAEMPSDPRGLPRRERWVRAGQAPAARAGRRVGVKALAVSPELLRSRWVRLGGWRVASRAARAAVLSGVVMLLVVCVCGCVCVCVCVWVCVCGGWR